MSDFLKNNNNFATSATNISTSGSIVTIPNNGTAPGNFNGDSWTYTNQCFWLSILEGLKTSNIEKKPSSLLELRRKITQSVGNDNINKANEMFDTEKYFNCLVCLTNMYQITLIIYSVKNNSLIKHLWTIGEYDKVVNIAFNGNHFEYIVQIK